MPSYRVLDMPCVMHPAPTEIEVGLGGCERPMPFEGLRQQGAECSAASPAAAADSGPTLATTTRLLQPTIRLLQPIRQPIPLLTSEGTGTDA